MRYYLIGFKSCGKSVIGRRLAELRGMAFVDLDDRIEQAYRRQTGKEKTFREIFREIGDEAFRKMESRELEQLAAQGDLIVSVGGGTPMNADNARRIKESGKVIYIAVDPEVLYQRIIAGGIPANFDAADPRGSFDKLLARRQPVYEQLADHRIETTGLDIDPAARKIHKVLSQEN